MCLSFPNTECAHVHPEGFLSPPSAGRQRQVTYAEPKKKARYSILQPHSGLVGVESFRRMLADRCTAHRISNMMQESASRKPGRLWSGPEPVQNRGRPSPALSHVLIHPLPMTGCVWRLPSPLPDLATSQERGTPCDRGESPFPEQGGSYAEWDLRWNTLPPSHSLPQDTHVVKNQPKTTYEPYTSKDSSECDRSGHRG